jgi:DNA-binding MarR family transcriptional regulator
VRFKEIDDDRLEAWAAFLRAHAALTAALERELLSERGMPLSWYEVLLRLIAAPEGSLRMQELARAVFFSKSGVTRLIDRMEEAGLVERRHCPSDRRGTYASITDSGRSAFRRAVPVHLAGIREHFGNHLSDEETAVLRDVLSRVAKWNVEGDHEQGPESVNRESGETVSPSRGREPARA